MAGAVRREKREGGSQRGGTVRFIVTYGFYQSPCFIYGSWYLRAGRTFLPHDATDVALSRKLYELLQTQRT